MSRSRGCVVEFVGLPASGKTRVATEVQNVLLNQLADESTDHFDRITTSTERRDRIGAPGTGVMVTSEFLSSPRRSLSGFRALQASRQHSAGRLFRYAIYQLFVCEELQRARQAPGLHLADQGFFQHLWRVHLTADRDDLGYVRALTQTYTPLVIPDLMVVVTVDHRTRMRRGVKRGTSVADELFDPNHPEILKDERAFQDIVAVSQQIAANPGTEFPIVEIENTRSNLEENARRLAKLTLDNASNPRHLPNPSPAF